jgi:hypothetical protein
MCLEAQKLLETKERINGFRVQISSRNLSNTKQDSYQITLTFRGKMTRQEHATDRVKQAASSPASPKLETPGLGIRGCIYANSKSLLPCDPQ